MTAMTSRHAAACAEMARSHGNSIRVMAEALAASYHRDTSLVTLLPDLCDRPMAPFRTLRRQYRLTPADDRWWVTQDIRRRLAKRFKARLRKHCTPAEIAGYWAALIAEKARYERQGMTMPQRFQRQAAE